MSARISFPDPKPSDFKLSRKRTSYYNVAEILKSDPNPVPEDEIKFFEAVDLIYRTVCNMLFNFAQSGHPGGGLSSGRIVEGLLYNYMDYDFSKPDIPENDMICYTAGHKAMGLYAMWAVRNELARVGAPELMAGENRELRLEDLLGFRRNPTQETPLFKKFKSKSLDGHPSCIVPFVKTATGPSGVGVPAACGLAFGALDIFPHDPPKAHLLEGEGGMTPGRVYEAIAAAASAQLHNVIMHIDWNQSSIDSDGVTAENGKPGEYVQWDPVDLMYLNDWNVIFAPEGHNFQHVLTAQKLALSLDTKHPTAIVYRTVKGWSYGVTGKASHGAGHKMFSDEYYGLVKEFEDYFGMKFPRLEGEKNKTSIEKNYWDSLLVIRAAIESNKELAKKAGAKLKEAGKRLEQRDLKPRPDRPNIEALYTGGINPEKMPKELEVAAGTGTTLRGELGKVLNTLNKKTSGAFIATAADLFGSTSIKEVNKGFQDGLYNSQSRPGSRLIAVGGICEDAMGAFMSGVSSYRSHVGVTASYAAFVTAMEHTAARCHCIGQQNYWEITKEPFRTWIIVNGHAGPKTGEDGPTHADPQCLQLLTEDFPKGKMITLTPWDPMEIWHLVTAALKHRPAVLSPFVSRPSEIVVDRKALGIPEAAAAVKGVYAFRKADNGTSQYNGTLVLLGSAVATAFVNDVLKEVDALGFNMNIYYIASTELFKLLPEKEQESIFPQRHKFHSMGMTDFTLPTLYQWVRSDEGLRRTLYPFRKGHYLGSGTGPKVLEEADLHPEGQLAAITDYAKMIETRDLKNGILE